VAISNAEMVQLYQALGVGKLPMTGGPAGSLKSAIAMTMPLEVPTSSLGPSTGIMYLSAVYITQGQTISNINFITTGAANTPTHTWFALYDDGRGSSSANQLALLGQTADQGSGAVAANTNLGLALNTPWVAQYTGIYYLAFMQAATGTSGLMGLSGGGTAGLQVSGTTTSATFSMTAGSGLTGLASNPSGTLSSTPFNLFAYAS